MFLHSGQWVLSPTDLTNAMACEFAVLRALDIKLGRAAAADVAQDAMLARTATLGIAHEARVLRRYLTQFGAHDPASGTGVVTIDRPERGAPVEAAEQTWSVLATGADVVFQAAFLSGRFSGYADFLVRQDNGAYAVYDTKLARHAKVSALLQLAAYGDELQAHGIPVAPQVHLILGDDSVSSYDLHEIVPVYRQRRARLEALVDEHLAGQAAAAWGDPLIAACGRCDTCAAEVAAHRDVLMVAGLRLTQRARLLDAGVRTIDSLAVAAGPIEGLRGRTLETLRAQAALQVRQSPPDGTAGPVVSELYQPDGLALLPPPDAGDIFFDFEGDPLWSDATSATIGLEYLFGVLEIDGEVPRFRPFWAHDRTQERQALADFLAYIADRRGRFPGMHIYHYASYEKSALLRLAGRYGEGEAIIDDLLRHNVLVDLFAIVRTCVRVSQPSYSLKKLEPLYMGDDLRQGDVVDAGASIVAYAEFCDLRDDGHTGEAQVLLDSIADYNHYDCRSTRGLREWLLAQAHELGVVSTEAEEAHDAEATDDADELTARLLAYAGDAQTSQRSPEQQGLALLAASVGYHRREDKPFWWAHYDRLTSPIDDWAELTDVLTIDSTHAIGPWGRSGRQRNDRRTLRLTGRLGVGSQLGPGSAVYALYDVDNSPAGIPAPPGSRAVSKSVTVLSRSESADGRDVITVEEAAPTGVAAWSCVPVALVPGRPIDQRPVQRAIAALAKATADRLDAHQSLPSVAGSDAVLHLLTRYPPRTGEPGLPPAVDDDYIAAVIAAVRGLDGSYLAVQGPPGSGKTHVGAHVIKTLVDEGWRIGVVAQSHKVIENLLTAVSKAGLPAAQIAKRSRDGSPPVASWTTLADAGLAPYLAEATAAGRGCVIGGTAWDFSNRSRVAAKSLDLLVVDEAGQYCVANTIAASTAARNLLLLGDPQQLPQVSQGTHPEPCDESALAWVAGGHRVMPPELGYFLARTWRMHPALTAAVSQLAYDGELRANEAVTASRSLAGVTPGIRVIEVDHVGNSVESAEEADAVVAAVRDLVGRIWTDPHTTPAPRPLGGHDILVVAPYNAQVAMIRRRLDAAGHTGVQVGSVDRFQGQEAPVVIVSMTASAPEDVPRGMDFLLSRNRVNVAVSRGQWTAVIVRSPRLTDYLPTHPDGLTRLGAFLRLCASPEALA